MVLRIVQLDFPHHLSNKKTMRVTVDVERRFYHSYLHDYTRSRTIASDKWTVGKITKKHGCAHNTEKEVFIYIYLYTCKASRDCCTGRPNISEKCDTRAIKAWAFAHGRTLCIISHERRRRRRQCISVSRGASMGGRHHELVAARPAPSLIVMIIRGVDLAAAAAVRIMTAWRAGRLLRRRRRRRRRPTTVSVQGQPPREVN